MKELKNDVWVGIADKTNDPDFIESASSEFSELPVVDALSDQRSLEVSSNRRDFLKYLGFGLGAATVAAGCDIPVRKAIPYVIKPDEIVPGVASYYASSYVQGGDYCAILVKTREGRPIKIEGNALSPITKGGTSARAQASVLSLYDTSRFTGPGSVQDGEYSQISWNDLDQAVSAKLRGNARIRILSNTNMSPTAQRVLAEFIAKYPNTEVVSYDPVSASALLEANEQCFGVKAIPNYQFGKAQQIVSLGADFLGTWISPVEYAADYATNRSIKDVKKAKMSRHIQVESGMSLTGSNADQRIMIKPSEQGAAIATLYNEVAKLTGGSTVQAPSINAKAAAALAVTAKDLANHNGQAIVVSGSNNVGEQILINKINDLLGSYGRTMSFANASMQRKGTDAAIQGLIREMNNGGVDVVFVMGGANPAFDLPNAAAFQEAFAKVGTKVSFAGIMDETTALCNYIAPAHHLLESWGDVEPKQGMFGLIQPTIAPLFQTRQAEESLLKWSNNPQYNGKADQPYYEYLKANWQANLFAQQSEFSTFQGFWDNALHNGLFNSSAVLESAATAFAADVHAAVAKINTPAQGDGMEISFYEAVNMGHGQFANNPWLQEMPDPITRCVWGNYLSVPVEWDGINKIRGIKGIGAENSSSMADLVDIGIEGLTQRVVAVPQFGQMPGTLAIGLGYGRKVVGMPRKELGQGVGTDVFPWLGVDKNGNTQYYATGIEMSGIVGREDEFACVQYHHTMGVKALDKEVNEVVNVDEKALGHKGYQGALTDRSILYHGSLNKLNELVAHIGEKRHEAAELNSKTLYPYEEYKAEFYDQGHHWGMHIDLNACIGCGACTVACMAENNVPVVGKREVHRHHEMSWLRIDRYYYGDFENPSVVYQPLMCQHCDNAPCENVCPVAATNHSSEGLNQMTYNRCIGTRYCANNCPYKVRRFNWLDYTTADIFSGNQPQVNNEEVPFGADNLTRMVLNPDVTVRSRGVIEKCSFCVQRIQEGKLAAKIEQRPLSDDDVKPACQTACPTGAIVFGDTNNKKGSVHKAMDNPLTYYLLEEINVLSSVAYTAKVRNTNDELDV